MANVFKSMMPGGGENAAAAGGGEGGHHLAHLLVQGAAREYRHLAGQVPGE